MNPNVTTVLNSLREMNPFQLASNLQDGTSPDSATSPGAHFLERVRDEVVEALEYAVESNDMTFEIACAHVRGDASHELADGAVPIYTYDRWQTFTDLGAWDVDVSEYGTSEQDMTTMAGVALYEVARVLVDALCEYAGTRYGELGGEDDDTDETGKDPELDSPAGQ